MRIKVLMGLLTVTFLTLLPVACTCGATLTITPPTTTRPATEPPSVGELTKAHFALPEIPRTTGEMTLSWWMPGLNGGFQPGHLPGAINIPNELVPPALPEEMEEAPIELMKLMILPKDRLIVFYCD